MKPLPRWFIALTWVVAVGFSLCVGLQVNDPDPVPWMAIYGAAAIAAALLPAGRFVALGSGVIGVAAAAWSAFLWTRVADKIGPGDLVLKMSEHGGAVEVGREAAGLAIIALVMVVMSAFRATRA